MEISSSYLQSTIDIPLSKKFLGVINMENKVHIIILPREEDLVSWCIWLVPVIYFSYGMYGRHGRGGLFGFQDMLLFSVPLLSNFSLLLIIRISTCIQEATTKQKRWCPFWLKII
jgi:hypothetical protein